MLVNVNRRAFLSAGLAASFLAMFPADTWAVDIPKDDLDAIGPNAPPNIPFNESRIGSLSDPFAAALTKFAEQVIGAWDLPGMQDYPATIPSILSMKTSVRPSYLAEYESAGRLITDAATRLTKPEEVFAYVMFAERGGIARLNTRLGRARAFVFDEIVRHLIANGGFRKFGTINYAGYICASFYDEKSFRRATNV